MEEDRLLIALYYSWLCYVPFLSQLPYTGTGIEQLVMIRSGLLRITDVREGPAQHDHHNYPQYDRGKLTEGRKNGTYWLWKAEALLLHWHVHTELRVIGPISSDYTGNKKFCTILAVLLPVVYKQTRDIGFLREIMGYITATWLLEPLTIY